MAFPSKATEAEPINLRMLVEETVDIPIVGTAPLILNRFSEKARKQMLEAQNKVTAKAKREPQNPEAEFHAARYLMDDGQDGVPAVAFKAAIVGAARLFDGITMTKLKAGLFVPGQGVDQLIPILAAPPRMREDVARTTTGVATLRFRPEYHPWRVNLTVTFLPSVISKESVVALVNAAGRGGIGEWRPSAMKSATGSYGQFKIDGVVNRESE